MTARRAGKLTNSLKTALSNSTLDEVIKAAETLKDTQRIYCGQIIFIILQDRLGILYGNEFKWRDVYFTYKPDMPKNAIGSRDPEMVKAIQNILVDKPIIVHIPAEVREIDINIGFKESITCPKCQRTSYNRNDIQQKYCSKCGYHDD